MPLLSVEGLVKNYGRRRVVDGVDFHVETGEIVGLLGPNGAGKTTSFRMSGGRVSPDSGRVLLDDVEITARAGLHDVLAHLGLEEGDPSLDAVVIKVFASTMDDETKVRAVWDDVWRRSPVAMTLAKAARQPARKSSRRPTVACWLSSLGRRTAAWLSTAAA